MTAGPAASLFAARLPGPAPSLQRIDALGDVRIRRPARSRAGPEDVPLRQEGGEVRAEAQGAEFARLEQKPGQPRMERQTGHLPSLGRGRPRGIERAKAAEKTDAGFPRRCRGRIEPGERSGVLHSPDRKLERER